MTDEQEKTDVTLDPDQAQPEAESPTEATSTQTATDAAQVEAATTEVPQLTPPQNEEPQAAIPESAVPSSAEEMPKAHDFLEKQRLRAKVEEPVPSLQQEVETNDAPSMTDLDNDIEQEIEAAMGGMSEQDVYGNSATAQRSKKDGGRNKGSVISIHGADVFVDVPGSRSQGVLSMDQFPEGKPDIGTEVEVSIEKYDAENGLLILSRRGEAVTVDWSSVSTGTVVEARVTGTNKGGLTVDVNGIRGFMPVSQIDLYRVENPEQFVNQRLKCMVTEVNPQERNLVTSRRALMEQEREKEREKLWENLQVGQDRQGVVRSVRPFGAFVDLGGIDGLLHVSEMSWAHVEDPNDVVKPGQTVQVKILKLDPGRRKISLGLKQLAASPWDAADEKYAVNVSVKGKVTRIMNFGAFVQLEPGVEGLIHISELGDHRVNRVSDVVQVGQEVDVTVLRVDMEQQRIGLSMRSTHTPSGEDDYEDYRQDQSRSDDQTHLRGGIGS